MLVALALITTAHTPLGPPQGGNEASQAAAKTMKRVSPTLLSSQLIHISSVLSNTHHAVPVYDVNQRIIRGSPHTTPLTHTSPP